MKGRENKLSTNLISAFHRESHNRYQTLNVQKTELFCHLESWKWRHALHYTRRLCKNRKKKQTVSSPILCLSELVSLLLQRKDRMRESLGHKLMAPQSADRMIKQNLIFSSITLTFNFILQPQRGMSRAWTQQLNWSWERERIIQTHLVGISGRELRKLTSRT